MISATDLEGEVKAICRANAIVGNTKAPPKRKRRGDFARQQKIHRKFSIKDFHFNPTGKKISANYVSNRFDLRHLLDSSLVSLLGESLL